MDFISKRASKIMKDLRVERGYTQQQVADYIGITRQAYSRYENAQREPNLDIIDKICAFYMFSPTLFFVENYKFTDKNHMLLSSIAAEYEEKYWLNYQKYSALFSNSDIRLKDSEVFLEYIYRENKHSIKFKEDIIRVTESLNHIKNDLIELIHQFENENQKRVNSITKDLIEGNIVSISTGDIK